MAHCRACFYGIHTQKRHSKSAKKKAQTKKKTGKNGNKNIKQYIGIGDKGNPALLAAPAPPTFFINMNNNSKSAKKKAQEQVSRKLKENKSELQKLMSSLPKVKDNNIPNAMQAENAGNVFLSSYFSNKADKTKQVMAGSLGDISGLVGGSALGVNVMNKSTQIGTIPSPYGGSVLGIDNNPILSYDLQGILEEFLNHSQSSQILDCLLNLLTVVNLGLSVHYSRMVCYYIYTHTHTHTNCNKQKQKK